MTHQHVTFRYHTGQIVLEGDRVFSGNRDKEEVPIKGVIKLIVQPGSKEAEEFQTPDGSVWIEENWNGVLGYFLVEPEGGGWEDVEFIERAPENTT